MMSSLEAGLKWIQGVKEAVNKAESSLIKTTDDFMEDEDRGEKLKEKASETIKSIKRAARKPDIRHYISIRHRGPKIEKIEIKECIEVHPDDFVYVDEKIT
jgi:hypothetical protein